AQQHFGGVSRREIVIKQHGVGPMNIPIIPEPVLDPLKPVVLGQCQQDSLAGKEVRIVTARRNLELSYFSANQELARRIGYGYPHLGMPVHILDTERTPLARRQRGYLHLFDERGEV